MKSVESIYNKVKGQSLLELIIAIGIFIVSIFSLATFVLDSFISGRLAQEFLTANLLAEEGMEVVRAIRDNNWEDLIEGNHGLATSSGHWVFQGEKEDISDRLKGGVRQVQIENLTLNRKKITSRVTWQFTEGNFQEVNLVSYFTNWQKTSFFEIKKPQSYTDFAGRTTNPSNAYDWPDGTTFSRTLYGFTANPSITFYNWETSTRAYTALVLKFRYHANGAANDRYAVAFSTQGCTGSFTNLISPTSSLAADTTVSVNLPPETNLSQLCLKIYTQRVGASDNRYIYTRDIWVEGFYLE